MLTQHPELFHAVVIQVPLLDMLRYHRLLAGASWMAEYGDPDKPSEAEFLRKISPYHNLRPGLPYPNRSLSHRQRTTACTRPCAQDGGQDGGDGPAVPLLRECEGGHAAAATLRERPAATRSSSPI